MPDLPDEWHQIDGPGREPLEFWVGGDGGDRHDVFQLLDSLGAPVPCNGLTVEAEIRDDDNQLVAPLEASFDNESLGIVLVASSADANAAMANACVALPRGGRQRLGQYTVYITDSLGRWPIKSGDANGVRK